MKQNFWVWWVHRPTEEEMQKNWINELYIDAYGLIDKPKDDKELKDYIDLCKKYKIKPYLIVNGYASSDYIGKTIDEITDIMISRAKVFKRMGANIMLDYLRSNGYTNIKITRTLIKEMLIYIKNIDPNAKFAVFNWWKSWLHTQIYSDIRPHITICPMIYGIDWKTRFWLWFHTTFFPECEPCIRAWDTTKEEFNTQSKMLKKYSIWKYPDWKELFEK